MKAKVTYQDGRVVELEGIPAEIQAVLQPAPVTVPPAPEDLKLSELLRQFREALPISLDPVPVTLDPATWPKINAPIWIAPRHQLWPPLTYPYREVTCDSTAYQAAALTYCNSGS